MFSPVVSSYLGDISFITIYISSLIIGSLITLYFHKNDYGYRAIGASGAVTGIVYSAILLQPDMSLYLFLFLSLFLHIFSELGIYCILYTE